METHVESNDDVPTQSSQAKANAPSVDVMKYKCMEKKCRENGVEMTILFCDRKNSILEVQFGYTYSDSNDEEYDINVFSDHELETKNFSS